MLYLPRKTLTLCTTPGEKHSYSHLKHFPIALKNLTPILTSTTQVSSPPPRHKPHELMPFYIFYYLTKCGNPSEDIQQSC